MAESAKRERRPESQRQVGNKMYHLKHMFFPQKSKSCPVRQKNLHQKTIFCIN